ncbi:hypothetical protein [Shewanella oncorhynchi]|uniref:hypothetical protein n=1 Tax=Shewanella oncorhynchi TaxID=2726434 RepID=UPI001B3AF396|nr:hypothetical protein [Shewanella oncorhynchi]
MQNYIDTAPYMYNIVDGQKVPASPTEATHRDYSSKNIGMLYSSGIEAEYSKVKMNVEGMPNFYLCTIEDIRQPYNSTPQDKINLGISWQLISALRLPWI